MAQTPNVMDQLKEITECCICTEVYSNPKLLPCAHTFCLRCLEQLGQGKPPGAEMACPVCRKEFNIPSKGMARLPSNFFMKNLVEISSGTARATLTDRNPATALCDHCLKQRRSSVADAKVHCSDCSVNLCTDCAGRHSADGKGRAHRVSALGSARRKEVDEFLRLKAGVSCVLHPTRKIRMYCLDCRMSICMMCFAERHRAHRCSNVGNVSKDIRRQLQGEIERLSVQIAEARDRMNRLQGEKAVVARQVRNSENSVARRSADVKAIVEKQALSLVEELGQIRATKMKEIDAEMEELQRHVSSIGVVQSRLKGIKERSLVGGVDVLKEVKDVQVKIDELDGTHVSRRYFPVQIAFKANDLQELVKDEFANFVGRTEVTSRTCRLVVRLSTNDRRVYGMATLMNRWYAICWQSTAIVVFEAQHPYSRLKDLIIPPLKSSRDIASCERSSCLYITDYTSASIWKIHVKEAVKTTRWMSGLGEPYTLSVSPKGRVVLLTEGRPNVLEVFAPDGSLLRRMSLPLDMDAPHHAVETSRGTFYICHGWASVRLQRVLELGRDGLTILRKYPPGDGAPHLLNRPCHLALDGDGRVLVADSLNHRVVLLDSQLCLDQVLLTKDQDDLNQPSRLCYVRSTGQLLVGHRKGIDVYSWTE